ncbi:uncharacterized protein LOC127804493 [Diospyros lotus]|uniref:uncharacterized protein LOC127804493 n=1 Tax=Diospyros lotus TaxID=55363 RepID=UPI002256CF81|nr:uncharacterized protein LOC127804493 [Diospyros lotus]
MAATMCWLQAAMAARAEAKQAEAELEQPHGRPQQSNRGSEKAGGGRRLGLRWKQLTVIAVGSNGAGAIAMAVAKLHCSSWPATQSTSRAVWRRPVHPKEACGGGGKAGNATAWWLGKLI